MLYRKGEEEKVRYRTDRCFRIGEGWYIATREEGDIGPFDTRGEAERSVARYTNIMRQQQEYGSFARRLAIEGVWASTNFS